jgi:hypothetical protein
LIPAVDFLHGMNPSWEWFSVEKTMVRLRIPGSHPALASISRFYRRELSVIEISNKSEAKKAYLMIDEKPRGKRREPANREWKSLEGGKLLP